MIGFCEDCGAQNRLGQEGVRDGMVQFQCAACGYRNAYAFADSPDLPRQLSALMQTCPQIMAAFLFEPDKPPVIIRLPKTLEPSDLPPLELHLAQSLLAVSTIFPDVRRQQVRIADKFLTLLWAGQACFFCLISTISDLPAGIMAAIQTALEGQHG